MHLFNCLDPVAVKDHDGNIRYVPCGKCDYCRYVRSLSRIDRATNELRKHKYALLLTLTYHDALLPLLSINRDYNYIYFSSHDDCDSFCHTDDGLVYSYKIPSDAEDELYRSIEKKYGGIPVLYKPDVQSFIKRLRASIMYKLCHNNKDLYNEYFKITYVYCGEYGPSSYRPHYHVELMFDAPELLEFCSKNIYSLWSFGNCSQRVINTSTEDSHYCAQYANSINRLPSIYKQKMVAPFYETSRNGTFGFAKISAEEVERVFRSGSSETVVQDMLSGECQSVSTPVYLARKLFPTFSGCSLLSSRDILRLLRLCDECGVTKPKDLEPLLYHLSLDIKNTTSLGLWFQVFLSSHDPSLNSDSPESFDYLKQSLYDRRLLNLARSIFYCNNAYKRLCDVFDEDLSYCVSRTLLYLDNLQKYKLQNQLEFEDEFYSDHPDWLIYLDNTKAPPPLDVMLSTEFGEVYDFIKNSISHSHKNKRKNSYLSTHPEYSYIRKFDDNLSTL